MMTLLVKPTPRGCLDSAALWSCTVKARIQSESKPARFLIATVIFAIASQSMFGTEPKAEALAGVARTTREQAWIASPEPAYPPQALKQHLTGRGLFNLKIRPETYTVSEVTVVESTGHKILDAAAISALLR